MSDRDDSLVGKLALDGLDNDFFGLQMGSRF
jgi:hypothetical protein